MRAGLAGVLAATLVAAPAGAAWRVAPPRTVSGPLPQLARCHLDGDDNTPQLAADARHPGRILLTYLAGDDNASVAARSSDGGRTWRRQVLGGVTGCTGGGPGQSGDPGAFIGPDGTAYAQNSYIVSHAQPTDRDHEAVRVLVSVAPPGRAFGAPPVDVDPTMPDQRGYFAADGQRVLLETERIGFLGALAAGPTGGYELGPPNNLAILGTATAGRTWGEVAELDAAPGFGYLAGGLLAAHGAIVAVASRVEYRTVGPAAASGQILPFDVVLFRSTDGGQTWSHPLELDHQCGSCNLDSATTEPDGTMLVSWLDQRSDGTTAIHAARSSDSGAHWQRFTVATAGRATDEQWQTAVARSRDGAIGVLYYDGSASRPGKPLRAMVAVSGDGGRHWRQLRLSRVMSYASITNSHFDGSLGPEIALLARRHGFLAAYTVMAPYRLRDGQQDVVVQTVTRRRSR